MATRARPLSPHLQIYRWQISNTLSILHRLSGVFLGLCFALLAAWLVSLASGVDTYMRVMRVIGGPIGIVIFTAGAAAFCFHFLNGVRHLFWDAGFGFERAQARLSGWLVVAGAALFTLAVLIRAFA